jgi:hypothetical protein
VKALTHRRWLEDLVGEVLESYDPMAARARLPEEVRAAKAASSGPADLAAASRLLVARSLRRRALADAETPDGRFEDDVRQHLSLVLDLERLRGEPFLRTRARAEIAAFLAAALGDDAVALAVEAEQPGGASERAVARALRGAEVALQARFFPPGDPVTGLPLHSGAVAVLRRRLSRVTIGYLRDGRLVPEALRGHGEYAHRESLLLAEALSGLLLAEGPADERARAVRVRQLARLGLPRGLGREARRRVESPRGAAEIAVEAPERVRPFLLEQLLVGQLRTRFASDGPARFIEAFAAAAGLDAAVVVAARVEAAAQHGDHAAWFEAIGDGGVDWVELAAEWNEVTDHVVERVSTAVTENLDALVTEIRETGELGQLLAKATAGHPLTSEEKRKVKAQLVDLAKAVPALAIFAAPGGVLLLPLLAKLLPFNLLPSAWDRTPAPTAPASPEATPGATATPTSSASTTTTAMADPTKPRSRRR